MNQGDQVRFKAHGETSLPYKLLERSGDECTVQDERGRVLRNVPVELLAPVPQYSHSADGKTVIMTNHEEIVRASLERADECSTQKS